MSNFDDIYKMNRSKKRRKDMIFKILCAGTFLLLAAIVFTIIYLSLMKAAKEDFKNEETESVFDIEEIKEVSLDDIPEDPENRKDEQYVKDISEAFPEEVVEAVTKDKDEEIIESNKSKVLSKKEVEEFLNYVPVEEDINAVTEEDIQKDLDTYYEEQGYKFLDILLPQTLQAFTQEQCNDYDVSYELVLALMESESSFKADIGSEKVLGGEEGGPRYYGYMQLSADNCEKAANTYALDPHTPEGNIEMAVLMLSGYLEKYDNDWEKAIMAYKGGEGYADSMISRGEVSGSAIAVTNRACYYGVLLGKRME